MPAYLVFERDSTQNRDELEIYWSKIKATFEGHSVKVLAAYGQHEVLEGPPIEGAVIAEFPTPEAAKAWYLSPAYQEVAQHRKRRFLSRLYFSGCVTRVMVSRCRQSLRDDSISLRLRA